MHLMIHRRGQSNFGILLGLLLLSGLILFPFFTWIQLPAEQNEPEEYRLRPTTEFVPTIKAWRYVEELPGELAQFETVFWEPQDSTSLRNWFRESGEIEGKEVLEVGTGTGLIALCCRSWKAAHVVATDINPAAVACATYNADNLQIDQVEFRLVPFAEPGPFSVIESEEKFDFIISNPPWEDAPVAEVAAFALYDPSFALLDGLLEQGSAHLRDGGKLLLAYGAKSAILRIQEKAPALGWSVTTRDDRSLDDLPEVFLPGMLIELSRDTASATEADPGLH